MELITAISHNETGEVQIIFRDDNASLEEVWVDLESLIYNNAKEK